MSEAELLQNVREMARWHNWLTYHTHNSQRSEPGYPDLHLLRGRRSLFVELKNETRRLTAEQRQFQIAITRAGHEFAVWRPSNWFSGEIEAALQ